MKLVILTNTLTPYRIPYFSALSKRLESLTVVLMAEKHEDRSWRLDAHDFSCVILPGFHFRPSGHHVSLHLNYKTIATLRRLDPDVVLSGGFGPANIAGFVYCKLFSKKYVGWGELSFFDGALNSFPKRMIRQVLSHFSDGTVASSAKSLDVFNFYGAPKNKSVVTIMPIDVGRFIRLSDEYRVHLAESTVSGPRPPVLIAISRLVPEKGLHLLIDMYAKILSDYPNAQLWIAGDGPEKGNLERQVADKNLSGVRFLGFLQEKELIQKMIEADVFVFPTLMDTFGAVIVEAMACNVPVLASKHAYATHDLIIDGVSGAIIDPENIEASANRICEILALDTEQKKQMLEQARCMSEQAGIDLNAEKTMSFLKRITNTKSQVVAG